MFTRYGFFSVVEKESGTLTIRARVKRDLENLKSKFPAELGSCEILENVGTDYEFRIKCDKKVFSELSSRLMLDVDYDNFKNMIDKEVGRKREFLYGEVWSVVRKLG
jgi:hypothetical protein